MISAGIDCGAKTTKVVIMKDGKIIGKAKVLTGFDQNKAIMEAWDLALKNAKVSAGDVKQLCGTGSGKNAVKISFPGTRDL
ncbi:MAG: methanogenesis marker 15 protein, partial [Deltaproteobacteria bacterium]|nr:methanogenesis marker 15 protein [Deltaproteobacteria bacterium]